MFDAGLLGNNIHIFLYNILKRKKSMNHNPLDLLMNPASIAIVGAGNNPMKMGTMHALGIMKNGYKGKFFPIHPKDKMVLGYQAFASVEELPEAPDLAMLIVPADQIIKLVDDFGKLGTKRAIIITAGFRETGSEGTKNEELLKQTAAKYGLRFLGPNCMGIINTDISLNTTVMMMQMEPGKLGLASQSGTYVAQTLPYLGKRGIRFSKAISVGNSTDLTITDALEYLGSDKSTKAIALYIEGIPDIERFHSVARKISPQKPIVAQYVGGSNAGARAGLGHTGALAAPDHLYEGLFRQSGIIRVHSIEDLFGHGWALATQPPLRGRRIAIITNSGGPGSSMAHTCEQNGFEVPEFSESLQKKIEPLMPPHAPCKNPVDITFSMNVEVISNDIPEMVMSSGEVDAMVLHGPMKAGFLKVIYPHIREILNDAPLEAVIDLIKIDFKKAVSLPFDYGIPLVISSFFDRDDDYTTAYHQNDIPVFDAPEKAARAISSLLRYLEVRERFHDPETDTGIPVINEEAAKIIREALSGGATVLDEHQSKNLLKAYGVPVCREILVSTESRIEEAVDNLGLPVVLKACGAEYLHKTGKGLIYLKQKTLEECISSFRKIQISAGKKTPVLISSMIDGDREFITGFLREPAFGGVAVFGLGGIFAEALNDTAFRLAPIRKSDAIDMVKDIRASAMLGEIRGGKAVDLDSLASIVRTISFIGTLHPEISEIDVNPIIIDGSKPVVVDALVILRKLP